MSEETEVLTPEEVEASRPEPSLEVARLDRDGDVYRAMTVADEGQILDALQGRPSQVMVYKFPSGGKTRTGLSFQGVAEVVRTLNAAGHTEIRISPAFGPQVEEVEEVGEDGNAVPAIRVTVYAEDARTGGGNFGTATQPKFQTFKDKKRTPELDKFAFNKALSKAQRNAMEPLTPVVFRETLIAQMLGDETRVKQIRAGAGAEEEATLPPPLDDDRAKELTAQIAATYDELKEINRIALLPGKYHLQLSRAAHSHEMLEAFLGRLRAQVEHEREKGK